MERQILMTPVTPPLKESPSARTRKLGLSHIAFFRGYIEGLPLDEIGELYLETGKDQKRAKATLRWIRDELINAARREKPSYARLFRIPPTQLAGPGGQQVSGAGVHVGGPLAGIPSLEAFQAERDPEGFFSEAELIKVYNEEYASRFDPTAVRRAGRNQKLRKRIRDALAWFEGFLPEKPQPGDQLAAWLDEVIANRLRRGGILTINDLAGLIRSKGESWYKIVPWFGRASAARVMNWLTFNQVIPIPERALVPYRKLTPKLKASRELEPGIVPLEYLKLPAEVSGAVGTNRAYGNRLAAVDDFEAINAWIAKKGNQRPHTARNYRTQAERLLLWAVMEKGRALSSLTIEDCTEYRDFLYALDGEQALAGGETVAGRQASQPARAWRWRIPREAWIGKRNTPRWHEDWRPFAGPLSPASQRQALIVVSALFEYLARNRYLDFNPWKEVDQMPVADRRRLKTDHALTPKQWQFVIQHLEERARDERYYRLRFILWLAIGTGLRIEELVDARAGDIDADSSGDDYEITVVGKGTKERRTTFPNGLMPILADYMEVRGLGRELNKWPSDTPLIATLATKNQENRRAVSAATLHQILTGHFAEVAKAIDAEDAKASERLRSATTHWLRHTFGTMNANRNTPVQLIQAALGHADVGTTGIYLAAERRQRAQVINEFFNEIPR